MGQMTSTIQWSSFILNSIFYTAYFMLNNDICQYIYLKMMGSDILERKMNDILINKNRSMNKLQVFFVQRWLEILNTNTHSTYSVHYLNSHEALKEILLVCDDLINGEIRNENHLRSVIHEARTIIEKDDIFFKKRRIPNID
ncbi:hypothetical protein QS257_18295 [Terrilactibacillus sp. S3-3]|nr:hypothetical protein QS257_18295 [Terrilactibacillus sp. S3-3]